MRTVPILLLLMSLSTPAFAQEDEEARKKAEAAYFRAYYLETAKGDLDAAKNAYEEFLWEHEGGPWDLAARGYLGLARIGSRRGKASSEEYLKTAEALLAKHEKAEPALASVLRAEIIACRSRSTLADVPPEVAAQIRELTGDIGEGGERGREAVESLLLFGSRVIPRMGEGLRSRNPREVAGSAEVLVLLGSEAAASVLAAALSDGKVLFPAQVAGQLGFGTPMYAPAFRAGLRHGDPHVRTETAGALAPLLGEYHQLPAVNTRRSGREEGAESLQAIVAAAFGDESPRVRRRLLSLHLIGPAKTKVVTSAISDPDEEIVRLATALLSTLKPTDLGPGVTAEVIALLEHEDWRVRHHALKVAVMLGGEGAGAAVDRSLRDPEFVVAHEALSVLEGDRVAWRPSFLDGLIAYCANAASGPPDHARGVGFTTAVDKLLERLPSGEVAKVLPLLGPASRWTAKRVSRRGYSYTPFEHLLRGILGTGGANLPPRFLADGFRAVASEERKAIWLRYFGSQMKGEAIPLVREAFENGGPGLRAQLISVLAREAEDLDLPKLLVDPVREVRLAAARALVTRERSDALPAVLAAVVADPEMASSVMSSVRRHSPAGARSFLADLLAKVKDADGRAGALGAAGDAAGDEVILEALSDESYEVFRVAARIAGERHLLDAWPLLLRSEWSEGKNALKKIESYYLGMKRYREVKDGLGKPDDARAKAEALAGSEKPEYRRAAALALGALGDPAAISRLLDLVQDEDDEVRKAALFALERLGGPTK